MTTSAYFTKLDLENRLSAAVVRKLFDDNNDGAADATPLAALIADASSKVDSYLRQNYPLPFVAPFPNEVMRLALDVAVAYAAQRHPEVVRKDWQALMTRAEFELDQYHTGKTRLEVSPDAELAGNEGGEIPSDAGCATETPAQPAYSRCFFADMGDFSR